MSAASLPRPSWQTDECPAWCVVEHREDDPPADRIHDSAGRHFAATVRSSTQAEPEAVDLLLAASRRCGDHVDWIFVGQPETDGQHLVLSRESAFRLAEALATLAQETA